MDEPLGDAADGVVVGMDGGGDAEPHPTPLDAMTTTKTISILDLRAPDDIHMS